MTEIQQAAQKALNILDSEFTTVNGEFCRWCDGRLNAKHNCALEQAIKALHAAIKAVEKGKMTTLREAAQQALEALEFLSLDFFMLNPISPGREEGNKAIAALRAALADQPQTTHWQGCEEVHPECAAKSWAELEQAGCTHCTDPRYAGIRCNVCGRSS